MLHKVVYNGQGKSHKDAGSVRSDKEIPFQCAIYYFEVTVVQRGRDGLVNLIILFKHNLWFSHTKLFSSIKLILFILFNKQF